MSCNNSYLDAMTPRCPAGVLNLRRVTRQLSQSLQVQNIPRASFTTTALQHVWSPTDSREHNGNVAANVESLYTSSTIRMRMLHYQWPRSAHRCCKDNGLYCTVLAVLVEDNRLGHLIVHTFYSPTTVGVTIVLLQTQELSNSRRLSSLKAS
jgi:hypothetical protein